MTNQDSRDSRGGLSRPFVPSGTTPGSSAPPSSGLARPFIPGAPLSNDNAARLIVPSEQPASSDYASEQYSPPTEQDDSDRAEQAWSDLDWDADTRDRARSRGEHIALALEQVAQRIREGELLVRGHPGMSHEAAAAAVLAALVAQRR